MSGLFARVHVLDAPYFIDRCYDYSIPDRLADIVTVGSIVTIPIVYPPITQSSRAYTPIIEAASITTPKAMKMMQTAYIVKFSRRSSLFASSLEYLLVIHPPYVPASCCPCRFLCLLQPRHPRIVTSPTLFLAVHDGLQAEVAQARRSSGKVVIALFALSLPGIIVPCTASLAYGIDIPCRLVPAASRAFSCFPPLLALISGLLSHGFEVLIAPFTLTFAVLFRTLKAPRSAVQRVGILALAVHAKVLFHKVMTPCVQIVPLLGAYFWVFSQPRPVPRIVLFSAL